MATQIFSIVQFVAVAPAGIVVLPHNINIDGRGVIPDQVAQDNASFAITAVDDTNVTVQNTGAVAANCNVLCKSWHTVLREFGAFATTGLIPRPFIPSGGGAAGAGVAPITTFVFRPGGVTAANVFATWPELMAQLVTVQGGKVIVFDNSIVSPIVIPAGGPYAMLDTTWTALQRSVAGGGAVPIDVAAGATFTDLMSFEGNIVVDNLGGPSPVALVADQIVGMQNSATIRSTGGTPFFSGAGLGAGDTVVFFLDSVATLGDFGGSDVLDMSVAGTFVVLSLGSQGEVLPDALTIAAGVTLIPIYRDASSFIDSSQAGFAGTLSVTTITSPRHRVRGVFTSVQTANPDDLMLCDPSGGAFPINLVAISAFNEGQPITVKNTTASALAITVTPAGADTIDGAATAPIVTPFGSITVVGDFSTTNWSII